MPDWALEEPTVTDAEAPYLRAFWHLDTERPGGMTIGPIPVSRIEAYFERRGFADADLDASIEIIREMDAGYLEWQGAEMERRRIAAAQKG